ncbi:MAG: AAA family ATPase, partial [Planctomycetaceae bacterium]|nr:AAA family ATPase [Planctomycetaceae bacterium]
MNITGLEIERFGIWAGLTIPKLSPGLNVFYGGNEAGKSTMLEFIRSQLYGFGEYRKRFARRPGGKNSEWNADYDADGKPMMIVAGGILRLECPSGNYTLRRMFHPDVIEGREDVDLRSLDGEQERAQLLRILTCGVDETTFNNVFAIGLDELQRLGSLNDTEASEMLFRLSTGMDRMSIVDSIKEIAARRNAVLNVHENPHKPSLLTQLLRQRDKIIEEQAGVKLLVREYIRLRSERKDMDNSLSVLEHELTKLQREKRLYETAEICEPIWIRRDRVRQEIALLGNVAEISEETIRQLEEINDRRSKKRLAYSELKTEYQRAVEAVKQLPVNQTLLELTPKIEALFDEEKRIIEIDGLITEHEKEIAVLENRITEAENQIKRGRRALLLPAAKRGIFPETFYSAQRVGNVSEGNAAERTTFTQDGAEISGVSRTENTATEPAVKGSRPFLESNELIDVSFLDGYKIPSGAARKAKKRLTKARRWLTELTNQNKVLETKLETEMKRRNADDISSAVETTTETIQLLRRSQGIVQRHTELMARFKDLHRINTFLMQNQSIPIWMTVIIGLICAVGAIPLAILLFEQSGRKVFENEMPILWGLLGLAVIGASVGFKILTERSYSRKLEENQQQLGAVTTQIEQVKQGNASVNARLAVLQGSTAAASLGKGPEIRLQEA